MQTFSPKKISSTGTISTKLYSMMFSKWFCEKENRWDHRTDHCALLISLSPYVFAVCPSVCVFLFYPLHPSLFFSHPLLLSCPPCANNCHTSSLSPPAGVCLVISGGCWGSSQSFKWGSPPGRPRHTVVQVRKPAATLQTKKISGGRDKGCVYQLGRDILALLSQETVYFTLEKGKGLWLFCHSQFLSFSSSLWFGSHNTSHSHFIMLYFHHNLYSRPF